MAIKKFLISTGDGESEESELDSSGNRTIGYDDVVQRVQLSNAYVINNLYVSGSIIGNFTGSLSGSASNTGNSGLNIGSIIKFTSAAQNLSVGDIVSVGTSGLAKCNNASDTLSNAFGVVYSSGSGEIIVQVAGEATVSVNGTHNTGTVLYVGSSGDAVPYQNINSGEYITQVGFVSGNGIGKLIIQPRVFGQKA